MRYLLLPAVLACSSAKPADSTTTVTTTSESSPPADGGSAAPPITGLPAGAQPPPPSQPQSKPAAPPPAQTNKPLYSCFSYIAANTTKKRHNCMRTADCPDLLEQAKGIKGIRELTGCASVATVWCFHQLVKGDPEGVDVCQPTAEDCAASRTAAVKAKESVDTDCAQR